MTETRSRMCCRSGEEYAGMLTYIGGAVRAVAVAVLLDGLVGSSEQGAALSLCNKSASAKGGDGDGGDLAAATGPEVARRSDLLTKRLLRQRREHRYLS
eukprot:5589527-Pleurochrysis_carterae.AAC.1